MKIHIFPYSARKGTPAARATDHVPPEVRKDRCARLATVERELARGYYQRLVGQRLEVLVEQECPDAPGRVRGTDRHYVSVVLPGGRGDVGDFVICRGTDVCREHLLADR